MPKYLVQPWEELENTSTLLSVSPHAAALEWVERYRRVPVSLFVKDLDDGQVMKVEVGFNVRVTPLKGGEDA